MRLTLTTNDGEVLDTVSLSATEFRAEVARYPFTTLARFSPGTTALDADDTPDDDDTED